MPTQQMRPAYRLFSINAAGRIDGVPDIIDAVDDARAVQVAESLARNRTVEVWTGTRLVATLNSKNHH